MGEVLGSTGPSDHDGAIFAAIRRDTDEHLPAVGVQEPTQRLASALQFVR